MNEVNVVLVDLPADARGCVVPEEDGSFTVYINSIYNQQQRRAIFDHEMRHLLLDHHYSARPLAEVEGEADQSHALLSQIEHAARYGLPAAPLLPAPAPPACFTAAPQGGPAHRQPPRAQPSNRRLEPARPWELDGPEMPPCPDAPAPAKAPPAPAAPPPVFAIQLPAGVRPAPWLQGITAALQDIHTHWDALTQ